MALPPGREKANLFVLTSFIRGVIDNNGTYSTYSDVLIQNKNRYPPLATIDTYDYFNDTFDKNGRITYNDVEGRINTELKMYTFVPIPVPNECSLSLTSPSSPYYTPEVVDTTGHKVKEEDTLTEFCDSLKTLSSYYSSTQYYLSSLEQYTVEMAEFVKARIDHRIWEKKAEGIESPGPEPTIPSTIPTFTLPGRVPSIPCCGPSAPCCGKRFVDLPVDSDDFDIEIQRCTDRLTKNISNEVVRIQKVNERIQKKNESVNPPAPSVTPTPATPSTSVLRAQQIQPTQREQILRKIMITTLVLVILLLLNIALL